MRAKLFWTAACSTLFVLVYGACNGFTSQRGDVGTICFPWERGLPFVPWMIVPYWSIDLFFLGSFFLCRNREDLNRHGKRILAAILGAGLCFLLFPLRIGYERPEIEGLWKPLYTMLWSFDRPHNLFPSLHIALLTILADVYGRRTRGLLRAGLSFWFVLVALSTLLTRQHHMVDVAGGLLLGLLCLHLISGSKSVIAFEPRIGVRYLLGSLALAGLASLLPPTGLILLWPALGLALISTGYFGAGASVYGKTGARLPLTSKLLLAPCLAGQQLSLAYYRRRSDLWNAVAPGVWIGARPSDAEARDLVALGVTAVLDLTAEFQEPEALVRTRYRCIPVLDLTAPTLSQLVEAVDFIDREAPRGIVYVHCKAGYSRSAVVVGAWLLASGGASTTDEALAILKRERPEIVLRPEVRRALEAWQNQRGSLSRSRGSV
jgi:protein-tyrosine phosphatase/membrane-associated phospholipid phosphatase